MPIERVKRGVYEESKGMRTTRGTAPKSSSPTSESTLLDLEGGSGGRRGSREGSGPEHGETQEGLLRGEFGS